MYDLSNCPPMPSQEEIAAFTAQLHQQYAERIAHLSERTSQPSTGFQLKRAQQPQGPGYIRRRANLRYR